VSNPKIMRGKDEVTVAIAQVSPLYMDKTASTERAAEAIQEAGRNGAELVVFSEAWLPGYPMWTEGWDSDIAEWAQLRALWHDSALLMSGPEMLRLEQAARDVSIDVVIGVNELDERPGGQTIHNALAFIDRSAGLLGTHRKLCSPFAERTFYGPGDSSDIRVFDLTVGRVGGLICSEMVMSGLKAAMVAYGEDFHVASWVGAFGYDGSRVNDMEGEPGSSVTHTAGKSYAMDAGVFVLNAEGYYNKKAVPNSFPFPEKLHMWPAGGSSVFGPAGQTLTGPTYEEEILYAVCRADDVKLRRGLQDSIGYFARPDCLRIEILTQNQETLSVSPQLSHRRVRDTASALGVSGAALEDLVDEFLARALDASDGGGARRERVRG
jgi:nitrilase